MLDKMLGFLTYKLLLYIIFLVVVDEITILETFESRDY